MKYAGPRAKGLLLLLLACLLVFGISRLFALRFEKGDVYPAYSSLRSDPLGTMVLFESLNCLPGMQARRDFTAQNRLPEGRNIAYLHLAANSFSWRRVEKALLDEIDAFVARGNRLVITFYPEPARPFRYSLTNSPSAKSGKKGPPSARKKKSADPDDDDEWIRRVRLEDRWGVAFAHVALNREDNRTYIPATADNVSGLSLPDTVDWHSGLVLTNLTDAWNVVYSRGTHPVIAERHWGSGSVVLVTDSYFLSNEALSKERQTELLAWLISPAGTVYFDEAHLGVIETLGISGLMRRYNFYWGVVALLVLVGLFLWRSMARFVPPLAPELPAGFVTGKDNVAGFLNLLRRNIPQHDLLKLCFEEWSKSHPHQDSHLSRRADLAEQALAAEEARPTRDRRPVETYRQICQILSSRGGAASAEELIPYREERTNDDEH